MANTLDERAAAPAPVLWRLRTVATVRIVSPQFELQIDGGGARLLIRGELDIAVEDELVDIVATLLAGPDAPAVVVLDLRDVAFMDSSGLRALLRISNAHGSRARLGPVSMVVRRLLDLTGTAAVLVPSTATPHDAP
jgi:anti-anti-sigma factor